MKQEKTWNFFTRKIFKDHEKQKKFKNCELKTPKLRQLKLKSEYRHKKFI